MTLGKCWTSGANSLYSCTNSHRGSWKTHFWASQPQRRNKTIMSTLESTCCLVWICTWWCGEITWQAQDGEIRSTLCEAGALPEARLPQARIRVDRGDDALVEVLRRPLVHPCCCHYSRQAHQTEHEAHHLTQSGCHRDAVCSMHWIIIFYFF